MVYPLQKEIQNALIDASKLKVKASNGEVSAEQVADEYFKAIVRINDICVNRNRF